MYDKYTAVLALRLPRHTNSKTDSCFFVIARWYALGLFKTPSLSVRGQKGFCSVYMSALFSIARCFLNGSGKFVPLFLIAANSLLPINHGSLFFEEVFFYQWQNLVPIIFEVGIRQIISDFFNRYPFCDVF